MSFPLLFYFLFSSFFFHLNLTLSPPLYTPISSILYPHLFTSAYTMDNMNMGSNDMSGMGSSSSSMSMSMVFNNNQDTPLFSNTWTPSSRGTYAGTCIFLIALSIIGRLLVAFKALMEQRWIAAHLNRRYVAIAGRSPEAGRVESDSEAKTASLVMQGMEETVKIVQRATMEPLPWRFSVDLPRALIFLCIIGVSYLLYVDGFVF